MLFLGSITGASGGYNNLATGASGIGTFTIPTGTRELYLVPSASGLLFEVFGCSGATNTTAARGAQLNGPGVINGPYRVMPGPGVVVGIYNSAGGFLSVRVFAGGPR